MFSQVSFENSLAFGVQSPALAVFVYSVDLDQTAKSVPVLDLHCVSVASCESNIAKKEKEWRQKIKIANYEVQLIELHNDWFEISFMLWKQSRYPPLSC